MHIDELSKAAMIELEVRCNGKTMNFQSDIIQVINNSVLITSIKVNDQTLGFSDKFMINFLYKTEGKLYIWENVNVKLVKYESRVYHMIDLFGEGKPYNRRDAYRMYIGEDMPVYVNTASGPTALSVLVKDISETGVGFISKEDIDIDRTVRLKLKDGNVIISISGIIVRKEFLRNLGSYLYGCKFTEKNIHLPRYIARKQSEILKRKTEPIPIHRAKDAARRSKTHDKDLRKRTK